MLVPVYKGLSELYLSYCLTNMKSKIKCPLVILPFLLLVLNDRGGGSLKTRKVPFLPHYPFLTEIKIMHFQIRHKMGFYLVNVQMFKQADLKL